MLSYFLKQYRVTLLLAIGLVLLGVQALVSLPRESTPEIEIPIGIVVTVFPGASAVDIEELVTKPIENTLENVEGVDSVSSSSRLGLSSITVEFTAGSDLTDSLNRLREAVDGVGELPDDAENPQVIEISFDNEPIISLGLSGNIDRRLLTLYAEQLADELETISSVSSVNVVGGSSEEIAIEVDPTILQERGISVGQISNALRSNNINAPLGHLEAGSFQYDLRLDAAVATVSDVANISLTSAQGDIFRLGDIAHVRPQLAEAISDSRISKAGAPEETAVTLEVRKRTGGNIVAIVDEAIARAEQFAEAELPAGVEVTAFSDRGADIRKSLSDVSRSGIQTFIIVFLILWLFLGWKEAAIASLAVPFTFAISFLVFEIFDITLNGISLFSLILSLGLLVDTAIVIVEGIHTKSRASNLELAADQTIHSFAKPLAAGVLTTVAAFFPMLLVSGIIGQFLRTIPIVVSATLLASLFVALLILPAVAVRILTRWPLKPQLRWFDSKFRALRARYQIVTEHLLASRRSQNRLIATLIVLLVVGLALPFTGLLKTSLFPQADIDFILGNVELPAGSKLAETQAVMGQVAARLRHVPEIESFVINSGSGTTLDVGGGASGANIGSFFINLDPDRDRTSIIISEDLRAVFADISDAEIDVLDVSAGPPTSSPIEVRLIGQNLNELQTGSDAVEAYLKNQIGVINLEQSLKQSAAEFVIAPKRDALGQFGLTATDIAGNLRQYVFGGEVDSLLAANGDEISIIVIGNEKQLTVDQLAQLSVIGQSGREARLSQVADISLAPSISQIQRRDGKREVRVTADVTSDANANEISQAVLANQSQLKLPRGIELRVGGEQQETEETFAELYRSMILAVIAIAGILVIEFNSYRQPLIILLSIPLALIGVTFGLVITGGQLNFASFIGLVSLAGIVVNNAILLVDLANANMAAGSAPREAMQAAAQDRLRPIILTTITTAAGVAPLIWVDEFFRDMALTVITGLLFSTILTLILIPILYVRQQEKLEAHQA